VNCPTTTASVATPLPDTADSIIQRLDQVIGDEEMYEEGEARPPRALVERVKRILSGTKPLTEGVAFTRAVVRPLDGSIRITWSLPTANIRLVISDRQSYIFHETVRNGKSFEHDIERLVDSQALTKWLEWLSLTSKQ
jgi:hypothetical protein